MQKVRSIYNFTHDVSEHMFGRKLLYCSVGPFTVMQINKLRPFSCFNSTVDYRLESSFWYFVAVILDSLQELEKTNVSRFGSF